MTSLSVDELSEIRQRHCKSTEGHWAVGWCDEHGSSMGSPICRMHENENVLVGLVGDSGPTNDPKADAEFIAHAHRDIPRLLNEVLRLRQIASLNGLSVDPPAAPNAELVNPPDPFGFVPIAEFMKSGKEPTQPPPMSPEVQAIYDHNAREIDEMLKRGECHPYGS